MPAVLLATDADWVAEECEAALEGDHRIVRVRRGAEVIAAIRGEDPDVVVLDLQIGNMGGMAACMAVRQEEAMGRLPPRSVMMLLDRDADEFLARRSEADAWMVKPLNPIRLARTVQSLAGQRSQAAVGR